MKEMEYFPERLFNPIILANGEYKGYEYWILNLGFHPTAYVRVPYEHKYHMKPDNEIPIECHYGLSYSEPYLYLGNNEYAIGSIIGWDYNHYGDYSGRDELLIGCAIGYHCKKWSTKEIFEEVKSVIRQLEMVK